LSVEVFAIVGMHSAEVMGQFTVYNML